MENPATNQSAPKKQGMFRKPWVQSLVGIIVIVLLLAGGIAYKSLSARVAIDNSIISAPVIAIGPQTAGILQTVYVKPGDIVTAGQTLAAVGTETLTSKINGVIIETKNTPGQVFASGSSVVSMIDPLELRVVGTLDENKGLSRIKVGDPVSFTVDAFGSISYVGIVDEISPTSKDTSVIFSISDKRPTRQFDIKVRYDAAAHPEFRNGMSAKMKVFPQ
ncbi:MAG: putative secretion protein [Candidatus Parcubacteria bacterium]|nr:putative secretion protein [Candidatus Parcubacteria bacterium]